MDRPLPDLRNAVEQVVEAQADFPGAAGRLISRFSLAIGQASTLAPLSARHEPMACASNPASQSSPRGGLILTLNICSGTFGVPAPSSLTSWRVWLARQAPPPAQRC